MKALTEMTREELWKLFPILLTPYDPEWPTDYRIEKENIITAVGTAPIERISHIGSTAVPGLRAKPTIDILLEIKVDTDTGVLKKRLEETGYLFAEQPGKPAPHMMFMKGYTPQGFAGKVYHLHVRYPGDWDELHFRNYLIRHPEEAHRYGELKQRLMRQFEHDRDGYTDAKTGFIQEMVRRAREESR